VAEAARTFEVTKGTEVMHKVMFAAALAVGLITAPMPQLVSTAAAQQQANTPDKKCQAQKRSKRRADRSARSAEKMRRRIEGSQSRRQGRKGNDVAEILERLQQAP
jgi:hypothetical protein